ncbi:MAG: hypothetical protein K6C14_03885 [Eubacterium sp.]|nr:hypothetical protein [Eubacterium sp.]
MNFNGLIGNEKVKRQLIYLIESKRIPHALIFEGERGSGKRTLSKEFALNLFCRSDGDKPCRTCPQCVKVIKDIHPDFIELSYDSPKKAFPVDTVREYVSDASISPNEADYKIYYFGNCQYMSDYSQNALLKIIEEPPSYAIFILGVDNKSSLLETILSRCVSVSLEGVKAEDGAVYLSEEYQDIEYDDALSALRIWNGNIGKALESLKDGALAEIGAVCSDICKALLKNEYELLKVCSVFEGKNEKIVTAMPVLKTIFRDALLYGNGECISGFPDIASELSKRLTKEGILRLIDCCDTLKANAENSFNNGLLITRITYELRRSIGK